MIDTFKRLFKSMSRTKLTFFVLGIGSTIWFLIRVIPKPSRAGYPCMKASAPFMSAFVLYLVGLVSTIYLFREKRGRLFLLKGTLALVFVVSLLISFKVSTPSSEMTLVDANYFQANNPVGVAQGIFPGRVVWVHNQDATNANMANTSTDYWAQDKNCSQIVVGNMLTSGIRRIGGKANVTDAWTEIFKYFNEKHGKGAVGYTKGEKFAIKINLTNSAVNPNGTSPTRMDASPQIVLGILHQLIKVVGVPQSDIWIGDNYRRFRNEYYDKCMVYYPKVHYVDGNGLDGREKTVPSAEQLLKFSGRDPQNPDEQLTSSIPQHYIDADYFINIPCLKTHDEGGITLAAKTHQGTILHEGTNPEGQSAMYMHFALPKNSPGLKKYRHLVDYMGHEEIGGKTLLYIIDGLWAGRSWEGFLEKWKMAPFNDDYPSSIFMSQDAVAIESVGYDFLLTEYASKTASQKYPYMSGADDYLLQAADPANWPDGVEYDPEGDGTLLKSLGVYEHWNNATDMQYSRNLGTGNGIELVKYDTTSSSDNYQSENTASIMRKNFNISLYPNPFTESMRIETGSDQLLNLNVYNLKGQLVFKTPMSRSYLWSGSSQDGSVLPAGIYLARITDNKSGQLVWTEKIIRNN